MLKNKGMLVAIPLALIGAIGIGTAISQQRTTNSTAVSHAESLSSAFRTASDRVLPTVVKIRSTQRARRVRAEQGESPFGNDNPLKGTPFEDFFREYEREYDNRRSERRIPRREGSGSGVIIEADGVILTNNHVVANADEVVVELADGRLFKATDIRTDPETDLAVVRIDAKEPLPAARLGDSDSSQIGDWVLAIGNPFELEASVSAGIISARGRSIGAASRATFLQTDAAINPGNSGGPLVNMRGEVIGINTAIASSSGGYQGIGFSVPINLAKWVTKQLIESGEVRRAYLGVGIGELDHQLAQVLGVDPQTSGVVVREVRRGTPAATAGVEPGDVITHFAGRPVDSPASLQRAVERVELGSRQSLTVIRDGRSMNLSLVTEALPTDTVMSDRRRGQQQPDDGEFDGYGLKVAELDDETVRRLELEDKNGLLVTAVAPGSPAQRAGLQRGVVIAQVNGQAVNSVEDLESALKAGDGDAVMLVEVPNVGKRFVVLKQE